MLWNRRLWRGVRRSLTGYPESADFLQPGHHSGAFELTIAIVRQFARAATEHGKRVMVLMLPEERQSCIIARGYLDLRDLIEAIAGARIPVLNVGEAFERHLRPRSERALSRRNTITTKYR